MQPIPINKSSTMRKKKAIRKKLRRLKSKGFKKNTKLDQSLAMSNPIEPTLDFVASDNVIYNATSVCNHKLIDVLMVIQI